MSTENIVKFLETAYSDEKLAALLAHAQDGKLKHSSCCCLIGFPTADHAYGSAAISDCPTNHFRAYTPDSLRGMVSLEFCEMGFDFGRKIFDQDQLRCERLIPLILAEMERRESLRTLPDISLVEPERLEDVEAERESSGWIFGTGDPCEMEHNQHGDGSRCR